MKGNADCHTSNTNYRDGYDAIFGDKDKRKDVEFKEAFKKVVLNDTWKQRQLIDRHAE